MLAARKLPPLILTYQEARRVLWPIAAGYPWAEGTIHDLWTRCAPTPDSVVGSKTEKRIINPAHLGEWLEDVLTRRGLPLDAQATVYNQFIRGNHVR